MARYSPLGEKCSTSLHHANCIFCGTTINISAGVTRLQLHEKTNKHIKNEKTSNKQSRFGTVDGKLAVEVPNIQPKILPTEDQVTKAEIFRCLDIMESNVSFNSADSDSEKYAKMFPDSEIAKRYKQKRNNVRYMIQFGIAPVIQDTILDELRGQPFCFKFDEITTLQIKKQYDGYAIYH